MIWTGLFQSASYGVRTGYHGGIRYDPHYFIFFRVINFNFSLSLTTTMILVIFQIVVSYLSH